MDGPVDPYTGKRKQIARRGKSKGEAKERVEKVLQYELDFLQLFHIRTIIVKSILF